MGSVAGQVRGEDPAWHQFYLWCHGKGGMCRDFPMDFGSGVSLRDPKARSTSPKPQDLQSQPNLGV